MTSSTAKRERIECLDCLSRNRRRYGNSNKVRFTLRRKLSTYVSPARCPYCKSTGVVSNEHYRQRENARKVYCVCAGVPFKHEKGTVLGCVDHPLPWEEWTEDHHRQHQGMLQTPRGYR